MSNASIAMTAAGANDLAYAKIAALTAQTGYGS